ncbi:uncharacterized protein LOC141832126 [Curcuma longa]|uniref:uncharacterized protein LOC141832126 n=1 Tax=Curcuma longa TaxID=136217 RepID=UPI003D9EBF3E
MGKQGKLRAKERREQRRLEIAHLRELPYSPADRWWSSETVAVVTGASRGIGYEIARQLAVQGLCVVLAARDLDRGCAAVDGLRAEGLNVQFRKLDVTHADSVQDFAKWIGGEYGGLDILVNNAGVNFNTGANNSVAFAEEVIATNYLGTKLMIETLIPMMRPSSYGARILNTSSRLGRANGRRNRVGDVALRENLMNADCLSEELIDGMVANFLRQVKEGTWASNGWPQVFTDYSISKLAVNAYTQLMARKLAEQSGDHKIYINCYCPGWVKTAMTGWEGNSTAEEGADTAVWAVLLPSQLVSTGKFFAERREISF